MPGKTRLANAENFRAQEEVKIGNPADEFLRIFQTIPELYGKVNSIIHFAIVLVSLIECCSYSEVLCKMCQSRNVWI